MKKTKKTFVQMYEIGFKAFVRFFMFAAIIWLLYFFPVNLMLEIIRNNPALKDILILVLAPICAFCIPLIFYSASRMTGEFLPIAENKTDGHLGFQSGRLSFQASLDR